MCCHPLSSGQAGCALWWTLVLNVLSEWTSGASSSSFAASYSSFLQSRGALLQGVVLADTAHGLGMVITHPVKAGAVVFSVPQSLVLDASVVRSSPVNSLINWETSDQDDPLPLGVLLLYALHQPTSRWHLVAKSVVQPSPHPLYFKESLLKELQGSQARPLLSRHKRAAGWLHANLILASSRNTLLLPKQGLNRTLANQMYVWLLSRRVRHRDGRMCVPVGLDLANHQASTTATPTEEIVLSARSSMFVGITARAYEPGEEFRITYGNSTLAQFFATYGVVNEGYSSVTLQRQLADSTQSFHPKITHAMQRHSCEQLENATVGGRIPSGLLVCLRLSVLNDCEAASVKLGDGPYSALSELRNLASIRRMLEAQLKLYPTSVEQDTKLLHSRELGKDLKLVVQLRLAEKREILGVLRWTERESTKAHTIKPHSLTCS